LVTEPEAVGVPWWQSGAKALCLFSQSPQACNPIRRAPTWLTTGLLEWNALHTILVSGVWHTIRRKKIANARNILISKMIHK